MDLVTDLLVWLHFVALAMGGAASFGIPVIGSRMPTAPTEARPVLMSAIKGISSVSRAALAILIITGPLIVWLKYGGTSGFTVWFWVKMVLVAILLGLVIFAGILLKWTMGGDMAAAKLQPRVGMASTLTLLLIILSAVLNFH